MVATRLGCPLGANCVLREEKEAGARYFTLSLNQDNAVAMILANIKAHKLLMPAPGPNTNTVAPGSRPGSRHRRPRPPSWR